MKRTLKRESKVLEIVRREAIGAGGSLCFRAVQWCRHRECLQRRGVLYIGASVLCFFSWCEPCIQSGTRASIGFMSRMTDGCRIEGPVGWPHGRVLPARLDTPVIAGTEVKINSCSQGRGTASSWWAHACGSGTDARAWSSIVRGASPSLMS